MRSDGLCCRCAVGAHEACDMREPCDCRAEAHPTGAARPARLLTDREKGAALAALILHVSADMALHDRAVLRAAGVELDRVLAGWNPEAAPRAVALTLRDVLALLVGVP